jgi:hypothetical protein
MFFIRRLVLRGRRELDCTTKRRSRASYGVELPAVAEKTLKMMQRRPRAGSLKRVDCWSCRGLDGSRKRKTDDVG